MQIQHQHTPLLDTDLDCEEVLVYELNHPHNIGMYRFSRTNNTFVNTTSLLIYAITYAIGIVVYRICFPTIKNRFYDLFNWTTKVNKL